MLSSILVLIIDQLLYLVFIFLLQRKLSNHYTHKSTMHARGWQAGRSFVARPRHAPIIVDHTTAIIKIKRSDCADEIGDYTITSKIILVFFWNKTLEKQIRNPFISLWFVKLILPAEKWEKSDGGVMRKDIKAGRE